MATTTHTDEKNEFVAEMLKEMTPALMDIVEKVAVRKYDELHAEHLKLAQTTTKSTKKATKAPKTVAEPKQEETDRPPFTNDVIEAMYELTDSKFVGMADILGKRYALFTKITQNFTDICNVHKEVYGQSYINSFSNKSGKKSETYVLLEDNTVSED